MRFDQAMERHLQRSNSPDLGAWQIARRQYRNLLPIERQLPRPAVNAATGIFLLRALKNAVVTKAGVAMPAALTTSARWLALAKAVMRPITAIWHRVRAAYKASLPASLGLAATGLVDRQPDHGYERCRRWLGPRLPAAR
jgi:hypothetical protein